MHSSGKGVSKTNDEIKICPAYKNIQPLIMNTKSHSAGVMREGFAFRFDLNTILVHQHYSLSVHLSMYLVQAWRPGCY